MCVVRIRRTSVFSASKSAGESYQLIPIDCYHYSDCQSLTTGPADEYASESIENIE